MILKNYCKKTDKLFVSDGKTEWAIVLPEDPLDYEKTAAEELALFLRDATGAGLNIVPESKAGEKSIYLGNCRRAEKYKDTAEYKALNKEGFVIKTDGDDVYIIGKSKRGTLFGVYKFLEKTINYRYYAMECIKYDVVKDVNFVELDYAEMPDIEERSLGFYETFKIDKNPKFPVHTDRLRLGRNLYTGWIFPGHSYFSIMPKAKYFETHRDFYSPDGANLCLSNEDLRDEFFENVKEIISKTEGEGIMLGQEDNFSFCDCERCKARVAKDGGNPSGLVMEFSNDMARRIKKWLEETDPERKLLVSTFAYNATAYPPVKKDEKTGEYVPLDPSYVAEDNLAVMVVPRNPVQSKSWFDEKYNAHIKRQLLGWKVISPNMRMWTYCVNYDHLMVNFPNIYALKENYTIFKEVGGRYMFDQGATNFANPTFDFLRQFLQSELLWDTSLSTDALIDEFMDAYYMEEAPKMREYFDKVFDRWKEIEESFGVQSTTGGGCTYYLRKDFWSKKFIDDCLDLFREMRGDIERFGTVEEWDKYEKLRKRILTESLSVRYLLLNLYGNYFGEDLAIKLRVFHSDCTKCNVATTTEGNVQIEIC